MRAIRFFTSGLNRIGGVCRRGDTVELPKPKAPVAPIQTDEAIEAPNRRFDSVLLPESLARAPNPAPDHYLYLGMVLSVWVPCGPLYFVKDDGGQDAEENS